MDQKKIGEFLKSLRVEKGLTQEQLAEKFNIAGRTVSRWETGRNMPDISMLVTIADFYEIDVRELMEGERRSDMNEELKDVAVKMADYAGEEKGRLFKWIRVIGFIGVGVLTVAVVLQCVAYEPDLTRSLGIFLTFVGLVATVATTLYANGVLGKLVKKRGFVIATRIVMIAILVVCTRFILSTMLVYGLILFEFIIPHKKVSGAENYDKTAIVEKYYGDMNSDFLLFPDSLEQTKSAVFKSNVKTGLFDTDGYFLLKAEYDEMVYGEEVTRLSQIKNEIEFEGETYVAEVRYDADSYLYPAYVASDGYDSVYEYALLDGENNTIVYVIVSGVEYTDFVLKYGGYLKKDRKEYFLLDDDVLDNFTIYAHTFDEGQTYIY